MANEPKSNEPKFTVDKGLTDYLNNGKFKSNTLYEDRPENRSKYDDVVRPFGQDINEARAERQTSLDKIGNGLFARLPIKVASEVGKMVGYIGGAAEWATTGFDTNSIDKMTDNSIVNFFTEHEESLKAHFPIYTPKYVKEGGFWDHASSLSFYMDEGVDGLGFLISAMAPGAAMKGIGAGTKLAKGLGLGKNAAGTIDLVGATAINTVFEAGSEAKGVYDSVMRELQGTIMTGGMSVEEAKGKAAEAARNTFIGNGLVLLGPNLIQQSMFFGKFNTTKKALDRTMDNAGKILKDPLLLTRKEIAGRVAKQFGIGVASEGIWEEGSQKALEDYNVKKALSHTDTGVLGGFFEEYLNMIGTTEGQKSMFLGAIMGSIGGGIGAYREGKQENAQVKNLHSLFDKHMSTYSARIEDAQKEITKFYKQDAEGKLILGSDNLPIHDVDKIKEEGLALFKRVQRAGIMDMAVALGDVEMYETAKAEEFMDFAYPYLQVEGGTEVLKKQINNMEAAEIERYKNIDEHGNKAFGSSIEVAEIKAELLAMADTLEKKYQQMDNYHAGFMDLTYENEKGTLEGKEERFYGAKFLNELKYMQVHAATMPKFYKNRINSLQNKLNELDPEIEQAIIAHTINQIDQYKNLYEESKKDYNNLLDKEYIQNTFNDHIKSKAEAKKNAEKIEAEQKQPTSPQQPPTPPTAEPVTADTLDAKKKKQHASIMNKLSSLKTLAGIKAAYKSAETLGIVTDEMTALYEERLKEFEEEVEEEEIEEEEDEDEVEDEDEDTTEYDEVPLHSPSSDKHYSVATERSTEIAEDDIFTSVKTGRAVAVYKLVDGLYTIIDVVSGNPENPTAATPEVYMEKVIRPSQEQEGKITDEESAKLLHEVAVKIIEEDGVFKMKETTPDAELPDFEDVEDDGNDDLPPIDETDRDYKDFNETNFGAETFLRTTLPTYEEQVAMKEDNPKKNHSMIRANHFLGKLSNTISISGQYEWKVVTQADTKLYDYLSTTDNKNYEATSGNKSGVFLVLVDKKTKELVVSDYDGNVLTTQHALVSTNVPAERRKKGVIAVNLLTDIVYKNTESNVEAGIVGDLMVSPKNFAKKHGIEYKKGFAIGDGSELDQRITQEIAERNDFRNKVLKGEIQYLSIDHVSPGVPIDTGVDNPIIDRVSDDLSTLKFHIPTAARQGETTVATKKAKGGIELDSTYNLIIGELYAVNGGKPIRLNKRRLTEQEVATVLAKIKQLPYPKNNKDKQAASEAASEFLFNFIYWRQPKGDRTWSTIYDDKGTIYYGIDGQIKIADIFKDTEESTKFKNYLSTRYRQVNNKLISNPQATIVNENGETVNYREWLFNDTTGFTTRMPTLSEVQSRNAYTVYSTSNATSTSSIITTETLEETTKRIASLPFEERIPELIKAGIISKPITYRLGNRHALILNINDVDIPFYRSSEGTDGKEQGAWTPFFGFGESEGNDWLIKGRVEKDILEHYGNEQIETYSNVLNSTLTWSQEEDKKSAKNHPFLKGLTSVSKKEFNKLIYGVENLNVINYTTGDTNPLAWIEKQLNKIGGSTTLSNLTETDEVRAARLFAEMDTNKVITDFSVEDQEFLHSDNPAVEAERNKRMNAVEPTDSEDLDALKNKFTKKPEDDTSQEEDTSSWFRPAKPLWTKYVKQNLTTEAAWFKKMFGSDAHLQLVKELIDGKAFGQFYNGVVTLYESAEEGTLYHEAFHKVTHQYLTPRQRQNLYNELRAKEGKVVTYAGELKEYNELTDTEAEEFLAEDFRSYKLTGESKVIGRPVATNLFARLWRMIKSFVMGPSIDEIYARLAGGKPFGTKEKISDAKGTKLNRLAGLGSKDTNTIMKTLTGTMFGKIFDTDGATMTQFMSAPNKVQILGKAYNHVYNRNVDWLQDTITKIQNAPSGVDTSGLMKQVKLLNYTLENWALVKEEHKKFIKDYGITISKDFDVKDIAEDEELGTTEVTEELNESDDEALPTTSKESDNFRESHEFNPVEYVSKDTQFLIATLPALQYNEAGKLAPVLTDLGKPDLVDFNKTYNYLLYNLQGLRTLEEVYAKLNTLSKVMPSLSVLIKRLGDPSTLEQMDDYSADLWVRFKIDMVQSFTENTVSLINPETGDIVSLSANQQKRRNRVRDLWKTNLLSKAKVNEDNILFVDTNHLSKIKNPVDYLAELGITFPGWNRADLEALETISDPTTIAYIDKEVAALKSENKPINDLFTRAEFNEQSTINMLIDIYLEKSPMDVELSSTSADNKTIYAMSRSHYVNLIADALNLSETKKEFFERMPHMNNVFTESSQWIKNMFDEKTGKRVKYYDERLVERQVSFELFNASGLKQQGEEGTPTAKLDASDKSVQEINDLLLYGRVSAPRTADKSKENAGSINNYVVNGVGQKLAITVDQFKKGQDTQRLKDIFIPHFVSELKRIRLAHMGVVDDIQVLNTKGKQFAIFENILDESTKEYFIKKFGEDQKSKSKSMNPDKFDTSKLTEDEVQMVMDQLDKYLYAESKDPNGYKGLVQRTKEYFKNNYAIGHEIGLTVQGDRTIRSNEKQPNSPVVAISGISAKLTHNEKGEYLGNYDELMKAYAVNHLIETIEWHKMFFGDPALYKDPFKRYSAYVGTKKFALTGSAINNWINTSKYAKFDKDAGDYLETDEMRVLISKDVNVMSELYEDYKNYLKNTYINNGMSLEEAEEKASDVATPYGQNEKGENQMTEADAQGLMDLIAYRRFKIKTGEWTRDKDEVQYQYEQAWYKVFVLAKGDRSKAKLTDEQEGLLYDATGKLKADPGYPLTPMKPQYAGPQSHAEGRLNLLTFHKYSLTPLIPRLVAGTNNESLVKTLRDNRIGYLVFESGVKVGGKQGKVGYHNFYTEDGSFNTDVTEDKIQVIKQEFLGIQVDIAAKIKTEVIFGTQFRKLVWSNAFNGGVPMDFKVEVPEDVTNKEAYTKAAWKKMTETQRRKASEMYDWNKQYNSIIQELTQRSWDELTEELGMKQGADGKWTSVDVTKLVEVIREESESRKLADNLIESIKAIPTTDGTIGLEYELDTLVNRPRIETLLMSMVNSRVIRQTMPGDAMIQLANTGFESIGTRKKVGKSNDLQSYRIDPVTGETLPAEVMVPLTAQFSDLLKKFGSLEAVNAALEKDRENAGVAGYKPLIDGRLIELVGYRIPTQGMNSIDYMKIVKFLPASSGNAIILPSEIVAKSGGDFDIDKLNIFRPNFKLYDPNKTQLDFINETLDRHNSIIEDKSKQYGHITQGMLDKVLRRKEATNKTPFEDLILGAAKGYEKTFQPKKGRIDYYDGKARVTRIVVYDEFVEELEAIDATIDKSFKLQQAKIDKIISNNQIGATELSELFDARADLFTQLDTIAEKLAEQRQNKIDAYQSTKGLKESQFAILSKLASGPEVFEEKIQEYTKAEKEIQEQINSINGVLGDFTKALEKKKSLLKGHREVRKEILERREAAYQEALKDSSFLDDSYFEEFNKKELQNRLVELSKNVISHPSNFELLITPNSTRDVDQVIDEIKEELGIDTEARSMGDTLESVTILEQFRFYLGGKQGVGISAIHNTFHTLFQMADIHLNSKTSASIKLETNKDEKGLISLGGLKDKQGRWISDVISQFINLYVDVAKDPKYKHLNAGIEAAGTYFYLIHTGADIRTIAYLMTQPSVSELLRREALNSSVFGEAQQIAKPKWEVFDKLAATYKARLLKIHADTLANIKKENPTLTNAQAEALLPDNIKPLTKYNVANKELAKVVNDKEYGTKDNETLKSYIGIGNKAPISEINDVEYLEAQMQLLHDFARYRKQGESFTEWTRTLNFDTAKLQSLGAVEAKRKAAELQDTNELFVSGAREDILKQTIVGSFSKAMEADHLYSSLFSTTQEQKFVKTRAFLFDKIKPFTEDKQNRLYSMINNDFIGYLTQRYYRSGVPEGTNLDSDYLHEEINKLQTGENSLAKRLLDIKKVLGDSNMLVNQLQAMINVDTKDISNISIYSRRLTTYESNMLTDAYRELYEYEGENMGVVHEFAKDLSKFGIIQSGLNNSPITYVGLIPYEKYGAIVKRALNNFEEDTKNKGDVYEDFIIRFGYKNMNDTLVAPFIKRYRDRENQLVFSKKTKQQLFAQESIREKGPNGEWLKTGKYNLYMNNGLTIVNFTKLFEGMTPRRRGHKQQDFGLDLNSDFLSLPGGLDFDPNTYGIDGPTGPSGIVKIDFGNSTSITSIEDKTTWVGGESTYMEVKLKNLRNGNLYTVTLAKHISSSSWDVTIFKNFDKKTSQWIEMNDHPVVDVDSLLGRSTGRELEASEITALSGDAIGADRLWKETLAHRNIDTIDFTPYSYDQLPDDQKKVIEKAYIRAARVLDRNTVLLTGDNKKDWVGKLLRRDYMQVQHATQVLAIGKIDGEHVAGGTGYAVQMAKDLNKPVYVFDLNEEQWYFASKEGFIQSAPPKLSKSFAAIGTREISPVDYDGKPNPDWNEAKYNAVVDAMNEVIDNTLGEVEEPVQLAPQIIEGDIWESNGIPVITTNLGGIHGAGLANQALKRGYISYKKDGGFGDRGNVITFPVKNIYSDKTNMTLLKNSARRLYNLAKANPTKMYSLPMIGLGHGEGTASDIFPVIKGLLSAPNIQLVLPTVDTDRGKQGTARTDNSLQLVQELKAYLADNNIADESILINDNSKARVIALRDSKVPISSIAKQTGLSYEQVQNILSEKPEVESNNSSAQELIKSRTKEDIC